MLNPSLAQLVLLDRAGPPGPPGPQADSREPSLIKLPIEVIVVASDYGNLNRLPSIWQALEKSKEFWAGVGISLQPNVSDIQADESILAFSANDLSILHYWQVRKRLPVLYVGSESARVGGEEDILGRASNGIAIVAGNTPIPGGGTLIDEIMDMSWVISWGLITRTAHSCELRSRQ